MIKSKKITILTACLNAEGAPDMVKTIVEVTDEQYDLGEHYDLAEKELEEDRYEGPFVHFDENEFRAIFRAVDTVRPLQPIVIESNTDHYPELTDNPSNLPVSLRDYECAKSEIVDIGLKKFREDYESAACQDEHGCWYVERGNVEPVEELHQDADSEESTGMTL